VIIKEQVLASNYGKIKNIFTLPHRVKKNSTGFMPSDVFFRVNNIAACRRVVQGNDGVGGGDTFRVRSEVLSLLLGFTTTSKPFKVRFFL